jgi:hypothetical protein
MLIAVYSITIDYTLYLIDLGLSRTLKSSIAFYKIR